MNMLFPKAEIIRDRKYLDWLRDQPCIVTGKRDVEPAHLRLLGSGGIGTKPSDALAVSLHWELHRLQSTMGEGAAWLYCANEYPEFLFKLLINEAKHRYQMWKA